VDLRAARFAEVLRDEARVTLFLREDERAAVDFLAVDLRPEAGAPDFFAEDFFAADLRVLPADVLRAADPPPADLRAEDFLPLLFVCPISRRSLFTVRAAISSAVSSSLPRPL